MSRNEAREPTINKLHDQAFIEITPRSSTSHYLKDVWQSRSLILMFAWRDIVIRYKQTVVGVLWVLIRPLATMAIFVIVFGKFLKVPSVDVPYPLLILSGLIAWQFFTAVLAGVSECLFAYSAVVAKVYFPRLVIPLSATLVSAVDALVALLLLIPLMLYYEVAPSWRLLLLPIAFLAAVPASLGLGLWFASVAVKYRDFRNIVPFLVMALLYASPVAFSGSIIPNAWRDIYWINPLVGIIEAFRWVLFGTASVPPLIGCLASVVFSILLLIVGYKYFRRTERSLIDEI